MIFLYAFLILVALATPLLVIWFRVKNGHKSKYPLLANIITVFAFVAIAGVFMLSDGASASEAEAAAGVAAGIGSTGVGYLAAAISVVGSGFASSMAVTASASAAIGAISENENIFGKCLIFVGLAEGIALYGLLIGFMIISAL